MGEPAPTDTDRHDTDDPAPRGWVLRASGESLDIDALLARFGQVHRVPVPEGSELDPGSPCFLLRTDRNRVVGLWAVGEVVASVLHLPPGTPLLPAEEPLGPAAGNVDAAVGRTYAEVELLPLAKPIPVDALLDDARLARSALATWSDGELAPLPLLAKHVRALESVEWWIEAPTDEQRAELDRLLAAEDPILDSLDVEGG